MKRLLVIIGLVLLIGTASAINGTFIDHYPIANNMTYVNATSSFNGTYFNNYPPVHNVTYVNTTTTNSSYFYPWFATNASNSVTGSWFNNSWRSQQGTNSSQRFNLDLGDVYNIDRIYYENMHNSGTFTNTSIKDVTFWGSNSESSFLNRTYSNDTGWTQINLSDTHFEQHTASDTADPQYLEANNNSEYYRYYSFKFANNYGNYSYMGIRRLVLQKGQLSNSPWFATNTSSNLTGSWFNNSWMSQNGTNASQRFNIDLGSVYNINRIYYENQHNSGTFTNTSIKDVTFWGSNSESSFLNRTYSNDTGWTQINLSDTHFEQHTASDTADPQYLDTDNDSGWYRYYSFKFANNYGNYSYMGIRRIVLQSRIVWQYDSAGTFIWTAPSNLTNVTVDLVGGGGSGSAGNHFYELPISGGGYGGNHGEYTRISRIDVTPESNYTIVVGSGGQQDDVPDAAGYPGGASSGFGYSVSGGAAGLMDTTGTVHTGGSGDTGYLNLSAKYSEDGEAGADNPSGSGGMGFGAGGGGGGTMSSALSNNTISGGKGAQGIVKIFIYGTTSDNYPDFVASTTSALPGTLIRFTDQSFISNSTGLTYNWSFGDGSYSSTPGNVSHVYEFVGVYDVSLSLNSTSGESIETKIEYITIVNAAPIMWYTPNQVRFTVLNHVGTNVVGAKVNATYVSTTFPDAVAWLQSVYGVDSTIAAQMISSNLTMSGTTGGDGAVVFTMHSSLQYNITVTNGSTTISQLLYPKESDYNVWLPPPTVENLYEQVNATLNVTEPNTSYFTMNAYYQDHAGSTSSLYFYVNSSNGTPMYSTSVAPGTALTTINYTIPNVRGESYYYGIRGTRTEHNVSLDQGITAKGPNGVLVDLRLPSAAYYTWISLFILFLVTSISSKNNLRFMAILMPVMAVFFIYFGWLSASYLAGVIPFACLLGVVYYMKGSLRENYGVGGSGSLLLNIVVFLIILQMMIGFINGIGVFHQTAQIQPQNEFSNLEQTEIREDIENFGGINDPIQSANSFAAIGWATIKIALQMLSAVFIVGYFLIEMFPYFPKEFFVILQIGIYCLYIFFILKLIGKSGSESDF